MTRQSIAGLVLALALNNVLVEAAPGFSLGNLRFGSDQIFDNDFENVNSKIYNIITRDGSTKGVCVKHVTATGNGVWDVVDLPCSPDGVITMTSDHIMIYGSPKQNSFSLFSDSPSVMIVFQDNKCTERKYKTVTRKTIAETSDLSDEDCTKICNKINFIIEEGTKNLHVLDKHDSEKPPQNPKNVLNPAKTSYKSISDTTSTLKGSFRRQTNPTATKHVGDYASRSSGTSSEPKKQVSLLNVYNQIQASKPVDNYLKPVAVSRQEIPNNGITVTEQVYTSNANQPAPVTELSYVLGSAKTSYKSISDTTSTVTDSFKQQTNPTATKHVGDYASRSSGISSEPKKQVSLLDVYNQIQASKPVDNYLKTVGDDAPSHGIHTTSDKLYSYLDRLAIEYSKLQRKIAKRGHNKPSGDGQDSSAVNNFIQRSQS